MYRQYIKQNLVKESAIHYQLDSKIFKNIETIVDEMNKDLNSYNEHRIYKYYQTKDFTEKLTRIEKLLTEQFNIECIVGYNTECDFFSSYGFGRASNEISRRYDADATLKFNNEKNYQDFKNDIEKQTEEKNITNEDARDYETFQFLSVSGNYELTNVILEEGLQLDLKNVKFIKRPKKLKFYINMDFVFGALQKSNPMIRIKTPFTTQEFVAIMLHELGHCWEQVYSLFKLGNDVDVLYDIVREEASKGNRDLPTIVEIYYRRQGISKKPSNDIAQCAIDLSSELTEGLKGSLSANRGIKLNIEQQADEFASRFGYGPYVISGLSKLMEDGWDLEESIIKTQATLSVCGFAAIAWTAAAHSIIASVGATIIGIPFVLFMMYKFSSMLFVNGANIANYDNNYRRFVRVKNSTIRRLKFIEDPEVKKNILSAIDKINQTLADFKKIEENRKLKKFMENIVLKYNSKKQDFHMSELLEDLNANDIYVGYEKIKNLQRSK